jgi:hypothetical protein
MPGFAINPGGGVLAAADDQIWTCGAGLKNLPGKPDNGLRLGLAKPAKGST